MICKICGKKLKEAYSWSACPACCTRWDKETGKKKKYIVTVIETKTYSVEATKKEPIKDFFTNCNPCAFGIDNPKILSFEKEIIIEEKNE